MKNAQELRNRKLFLKRDAAVYAILLSAIFCLFLFFVILPQKNDAQGFCVYENETLILTCRYGQSPVIEKEAQNRVLVDGNDIYVYFNEEKTDYNRITATNGEVKITESTCSSTRDCVYEPAIKNSGAIYCVPHKLKITPLNEERREPQTGANAYEQN